MHIAYIDESGSSGAGSSLTFTLACVIVPSSSWPQVLDDLIDFRRFLKARFRIPVRAEIKANYLLRNGGPLRDRPLSEPARYAVYRGFMRLQQKLGLTVFAVVIRKDVMQAKRLAGDPRDIAWEYMFQRLERFSTKSKTEILVFHDEGDAGYIRGAARRARRIGTAGKRYGGPGSLPRPLKLLVDDPIPKKSEESYLIQLADLGAYAAFRRLYPPGARVVQVVPQNMWDELGTARPRAVNSYSQTMPAGIVVWPWP